MTLDPCVLGRKFFRRFRMIDLSHLRGTQRQMWDSLIELARVRPEGWTLIGAQMVIAHGARNGRVYDRATVDADLLASVRLVERGVPELAEYLVEDGFELEGISRTGIGHRFRKDEVIFDVLAPDNIRDVKKLMTVPGARTVLVPGGNQALHRTEPVDVRSPSARGLVPMPNLLGAILIKCRAVDVDDVPEAQLEDLVFLLSLVEDPRTLAENVTSSERKWLRKRVELKSRGHISWRLLDEEDADNGRIALHILSKSK